MEVPTFEGQMFVEHNRFVPILSGLPAQPLHSPIFYMMLKGQPAQPTQ